jgi:hypothetical protein
MAPVPTAFCVPCGVQAALVGELLKLGLAVSERTVARYLRRLRRPAAGARVIAMPRLGGLQSGTRGAERRRARSRLRFAGLLSIGPPRSKAPG